MPPFVRRCVARAHVLGVHGTLDVRTQVVEYRVAIKCRDESRHFNYGKPYTLPMKFWKDPLGPWNLLNLWIYENLGALSPSNPWTLKP